MSRQQLYELHGQTVLVIQSADDIRDCCTANGTLDAGFSAESFESGGMTFCKCEIAKIDIDRKTMDVKL